MIIDAHLHFARHEYMTCAAREAGHENTAEHLAQVFAEQGIAAAVAMGGDEGATGVKAPRLYYCAAVRGERLNEDLRAELERAEKSLAQPDCVGLKLYPGYDRRYPADRD